jgi:transcriptional regulator with PAS, ATPase and Fis domain
LCQHKNIYMTSNVLISWIGRTDLRAASGAESAGPGPIAQAANAHPYEAIHLLSDFDPGEAKNFVKWLGQQVSAKIHLHPAKLASPTHFGDIYQQAVFVLDKLKQQNANVTCHLSPGTPAMQSVWILLAKTTHPARLIQSSPEAGVEEAVIPFDISAEFVPQLLQQSDKRLTELAQGATSENAQFSDIIHRSGVMKRVIEQAQRVAMRSIPVLIEGESGTGKELMARAIHRSSPRAKGPFIPVNCGAIPADLVESEFFGHKKGAFTGAASDRKGHFELASGGTLFLDEVGELPRPIQVKLLRTLQEGIVTPVGSSEERKVDVRIIAATNRTLIDEVAAGRFREDLFYRLAVAIIKLPPLRDRAGDISLLIDALLGHVNDEAAKLGLKHKKLSASAKNIMLQHRWPGNVRELMNTLQRASAWSDEETISAEAMRDAILVTQPAKQGQEDVLSQSIEEGVALEKVLARVARHYIELALAHSHNNKTHAASLLGLGSYQTLTNWMKRYGIGA